VHLAAPYSAALGLFKGGTREYLRVFFAKILPVEAALNTRNTRITEIGVVYRGIFTSFVEILCIHTLFALSRTFGIVLSVLLF
jgi:hypothetical protein